MSFLGRFVGNGDASKSPKEEERQRIEAVERLCNGLAHAALLEDRRSAAQAIKSASKHYKQEVGMIAINPLLAALKRDSDDPDIVKNIIEVFLVICGEPEDDVIESRLSLSEVSARTTGAHEYCEILMKDQETIHIVISLLKDETLYLRYTILQFLQLMARNVYDELTAAILSFPSGGLSCMIELLEDKREVIRNELLLFLILLTEKSSQIQRLAIFEGSVERLFSLIEDCGGIYGGEVVVEDALKIVQNLLRHNPFNQNYFRESDSFRQLQKFLSPAEVPLGSVKWNRQVCNNVTSLLKIISLVCYRGHPNQKVIQDSFSKIKIMDPLARIVTLLDIPSLVRTVALQSLAKLLFSNLGTQDFLAHSVYPASFLDPRPFPTLVIIIRTALEGGEDHELRMAAIEAVGAYLADNKDGQLVIAATFKSPKVDGSPNSKAELSAGSMIIENILDMHSSQKKSRNVWYASLLLSHVLRENDGCKSLTASFKPEDATSREEDEPSELFDTLLLNLIDSVKHDNMKLATIGLLTVFATWLHSSPAIISRFLREGSNVQFLIELINQNSAYDPMIQGFACILFSVCILEQTDEEGSSFNRKSLMEIAKNRIGLDVFLSRLQRLHDKIVIYQANQLQQSSPPAGDIFDDSYVDLFLTVREAILKMLLAPKDSAPCPKNASMEADSGELKNLEAELVTVKQSLEMLQTQVNQKDAIIANLTSTIPDVQSQHELAKNLESKLNYMVVENERLQKLSDAYARQILQIEKDHQELMETLLIYEQELAAYRGQSTVPLPSTNLASPQPRSPPNFPLNGPEFSQEIIKKHIPLAQLNDMSIKNHPDSQEAGDVFARDPIGETPVQTAASHFNFGSPTSATENFFSSLANESKSDATAADPFSPFVNIGSNNQVLIPMTTDSISASEDSDRGQLSAPVGFPMNSEAMAEQLFKPLTQLTVDSPIKQNEETLFEVSPRPTDKTDAMEAVDNTGQAASIMDFLKPKTPTTTTHDV